MPLLRGGKPFGVILFRSTARRSPRSRIELLKTFADQAVIAIENVRLFEAEQQRTQELTELLQQQTATADVLKVISRSAFDLQTVFDTLVETATRLCQASASVIWRPEDDGGYHLAASYGVPLKFKERLESLTLKPDGRSVVGRSLQTGQTVYVPDLAVDPEYAGRKIEDFGGYRGLLCVPIMRQGSAVGVLMVAHTTAQGFTENQISLITTFADQAVIAIENVRLFEAEQKRSRELSELLEQQTATSEVLKVISSSPGELQPVFDTMLAKATEVCEATYGTMWLREGDGFRSAAIHGDLPPAYVELRRSGTLVHGGPDTPMRRVVETRQPVQVVDLRESRAYLNRDPIPVASVEIAGIRTLVAVPMLKDNEPIGVISIYRQEVRPFTDKQIELVQNFAAQAVIAIENTRLLNELRELLEQQTATSDVLKVISSSPGELKPVFEAMLENATRICEAKFGSLFLREGDDFRAVAVHGEPKHVEFWRHNPVITPSATHGGPIQRAIDSKALLHIADMKEDSSYTGGNLPVRSLVDSGGARTYAVVPLFKDDEVVGVITMYRQEVRPFGVKQIELVQNFAAQAVIAIENTRLLNELRQRTDDLTEALEQQTAMSEVLGVISSSPGDLAPVFDTILANATRLCEGNLAALWRYDGKFLLGAAQYNASPAFVEHYMGAKLEPGREGPARLAALERRTVHVADITTEPGFSPLVLQYERARTVLAVPLLREKELVGAIAIWRREVRPFTEKQIALVQNFAAQAVIAIENTRLLNELRELLEQQTATSEVLEVIASSTGELAPVFSAMLANAARLCGASYGALWLNERDGFRTAALHGDLPQAYIDQWRSGTLFHPSPEVVMARVAASGQPVQVADLQNDPSYLRGDPLPVAAVEVAGIRTLLAVPMFKDKELIGEIAIYRKEVKPFTDKQIELVQHFAAQAVIAIENARLLNELRQRTDDLTESLEQQTATSEVLQVISSSPGELQPVFEAMLENATRLCEAKFGMLFLWEGDGSYRTAALHGAPAELTEYRRREPLVRPAPATGLALVAQMKQPAHIADVLAEKNYLHPPSGFTPSGIALHGGARTELAVPMVKEGELIGSIVIYRTEVRPFADKQIELVTNFAAQAVIAIENTRLLSELRELLEQQTATSDVLKVISSSPGSLEPVFDAMLENAVRICHAHFGVMHRFVGAEFEAVAMLNIPAALEGFTPARLGQGNSRVRHGQFVQVQAGRSHGGHAGRAGSRSAREACRCADATRRTHDEGRRTGRGDRHLSARGPAFRRQADRAGQEFRLTSSHRH